MQRLYIILLIILSIATNTPAAHAQLMEKAEQLLMSTFAPSQTATSASEDDLEAADAHLSDSTIIEEMMNQLKEMRMNEILLKTELDNIRNQILTADSMKMAEQRTRIDSLRAVTPGVPVVIESDTLFTLYSDRGGYTARARAEMTQERLIKIGKTNSLLRDSVYVLESDHYTDIMYGSQVIISITDQDALWENMSRTELVETLVPILSGKIKYLKDDNSFWQIIFRGALFILVIFVQYLLFRFINYLFRKLRRSIIRFRRQRMKPIIIRDYELINTRQLGHILIFFSNLLRLAVLLLLLIFTVPVLFAIFPQTENMAFSIFLYIFNPIKMIAKAIVEYIPNMFIILVIWFCVRYLIKGLRYITKEIANEKLKISGFYPDWAQPTFNIIRCLLYAFMIAMIYPYLPGSDSGVFQGISVFVGLIISLGSSSIIGNIIAGLVITYMRPYKLGDCIKLNDTMGNVIEKTPFVTRLRTPKNEVVTVPNSFIMSSHTVNYSESARNYGLIIHTSVSFTYDTPWRTVHELLIKAALRTPGVLHEPKPFVLESELQDLYPCYQINAYIKDADKIPEIMSDLLQNIQDLFNEAGIELMTPHYYAKRSEKSSASSTDFNIID